MQGLDGKETLKNPHDSRRIKGEKKLFWGNYHLHEEHDEDQIKVTYINVEVQKSNEITYIGCLIPIRVDLLVSMLL